MTKDFHPEAKRIALALDPNIAMRGGEAFVLLLAGNYPASAAAAAAYGTMQHLVAAALKPTEDKQ